MNQPPMIANVTVAPSQHRRLWMASIEYLDSLGEWFGPVRELVYAEGLVEAYRLVGDRYGHGRAKLLALDEVKHGLLIQEHDR